MTKQLIFERGKAERQLLGLADTLRIHNRTGNGQTEFTPDHLRVLADYLRSQHPGFNRKKWIDYITGGSHRGMMVEKINSEPEDSHPDGTRGKVVGSLGIGYYFIAWDEKPEARWFVPETKIRRLRKKKQEG